MRLVSDGLPNVALYAGDKSPDGTVRLMNPEDLAFTRLRNWYLPGGLLFQGGLPWRQAIQCRTVVLDLNPRVPANWLLLTIRRSLRRTTILWGHAWPRSGRESRTERIRHAMRSLADGLIAYTESEANELRVIHPGKRIAVAPNALYCAEQMRYDGAQSRTDFVYVGRLVPEKKVFLLVEAFAIVAERLPRARLVIIGQGPESENVARLAESLPAAARIHVLPYEDNPEVLRNHYARAAFSISPGYVGLSAIQSFSFGVPMIFADREPHAPEIEAVRVGFNAVPFRAGDASALAEAMLQSLQERESILASGDAIRHECAAMYSAEAMAQGILRAVCPVPSP